MKTLLAVSELLYAIESQINGNAMVTIYTSGMGSITLQAQYKGLKWSRCYSKEALTQSIPEEVLVAQLVDEANASFRQYFSGNTFQKR